MKSLDRDSQIFLPFNRLSYLTVYNNDYDYWFTVMYFYFSDLERVREGIGDKLSICLQFISTFIAGFAIGFIKSWRLTLVMMSLTPILAICAAFLSRVGLHGLD